MDLFLKQTKKKTILLDTVNKSEGEKRILSTSDTVYDTTRNFVIAK